MSLTPRHNLTSEMAFPITDPPPFSDTLLYSDTYSTDDCCTPTFIVQCSEIRQPLFLLSNQTHCLVQRRRYLYSFKAASRESETRLSPPRDNRMRRRQRSVTRSDSTHDQEESGNTHEYPCKGIPVAPHMDALHSHLSPVFSSPAFECIYIPYWLTCCAVPPPRFHIISLTCSLRPFSC